VHLGSADRQSLRHQLQQNVVAFSPSTNHQVFPCQQFTVQLLVSAWG
jgi:hypothetical protein